MPGSRPILSTVTDPDHPAWGGRMEHCPPRDGRPLVSLLDLLRRSAGRDALVLRGSVTLREGYRDLVCAFLIKLGGRPPRTLVTDATWEPGSRSLARRLPWARRALPALTRLAIRALDGPHVRYAVLSREERRTFSQQWGVPEERVVFTPFPTTLYDDLHRETHSGDYVFTGGNSLRNYEMLARAVEGTGVPVRAATRWSPARPVAEVEAGPVSHEEFIELLAGCRAFVLPLERSVRSAGQQSYLNAMVLGKPVVVTDSLGVRDYVRHGVTGVVVPEDDPRALREAVQHVMDPRNAEHYREMGRRARADVLGRFLPDDYVESLVRQLGYRPPELISA